MLEFERTGALDLRSNKQSRRVCADARQFITEIKRILDDEQITFKLPAESGPIAAKAKKAIGA
jgi:hypothetical protein